MYLYIYQSGQHQRKRKRRKKRVSKQKVVKGFHQHCVNMSVFEVILVRSIFARIRTDCGKILRTLRIQSECGKIPISPYSVRMRENADQNNSEYGHFLRSAMSKLYYFSLFRRSRI